MKSFFLYITAAAALLTTACNRQHEEEEDPVIPVTGVTINLPAALLLVGKTLTLEVAVEPPDATNQNIAWSTSDEQVATVNSYGEIIAIAPGTATIAIVTDDSKFTATCAVTVATTGITMTTQAGEVGIGLLYREWESGKITIDWGDGTKTVIEGINSSLKTDYYYSDYNSKDYSHSYSDVSERTITITKTGDDFLCLWCYGNQLTTLDVSGYPALSRLFCQENQLTALHLSNNTALDVLDCGDNLLTALDVSANTALRRLKCAGNQLTTLDVSHNTTLDVLYCHNNQLTDIDVSRNTELTDFVCEKNQLTTLDISHNVRLGNFFCDNNQLTTLELNRNQNLWNFSCAYNQLTSLDVTHNTTLIRLYCYYNHLTASALNDLFRTLQDRIDFYHDGGSKTTVFGRRVDITGNPGASDCDISIAEDKEWVLTRYHTFGISE